MESPRARVWAALAAAALLVTAGCATRAGDRVIPLPRFGRAQTAEADPVYQGSAEVVYRTAFDAVVEEFNTAPRIVKPERGLLVFSEPGAQWNTSLVVRPVGADAAAIHVESRGEGGLLRGRSASAIRARVLAALDKRLARSEIEAPPATAPQRTSALAEKEDALERIKKALGFPVVPGYLIDMEARDLGDLADAIDKRLQAQALNQEERQTSAELAIRFGKELHDMGRYEEARDAFAQALELTPNSAVAHVQLGDIYKHLRDFDAAIRHLRRAEELDPDYPETYINLGIIYDDYVVDDAKALENYHKYLELGGTDERVHDWIRAINQHQ